MHEQQLEEFMASLVENNQRIWKEWSRALQTGAAGGADVGRLYLQGIDAMEALVRQALQAESEWLDRWHEGVSAVPGAPEQLRQIFDGVRDGMKGLLEQRVRLWESLLEQARRAGPGQSPSAAADAMGLARMWEDFYRGAASAELTGDRGPAPQPEAKERSTQPAGEAPKPAEAAPAKSKPAPKASPKPASKAAGRARTAAKAGTARAGKPSAGEAKKPTSRRSRPAKGGG